MLFGGLLIWLDAMSVQGQRLIASYAEWKELNTLDSKLQYNLSYHRDKRNLRADRCAYEEGFFVFAFHRVVSLLETMLDYYPQFETHLNQLRRVHGFEYLSEIYDMRSRTEVYALGKGEYQQRLDYHLVIESEAINDDVGAFEMKPTSDTYLIGGRIDVCDAVRVIENLSPNIMNTCYDVYMAIHSNE